MRRRALTLALPAVLLAILAAPHATAQTAPAFKGGSSAIGPKIRERMIGVSWHQGCPVPISRLRLVTVTHWGMDGDVHTGRLIVHENHAVRMVGVMRKLYDARFPIRRMWLVDAYGGSDTRSMNANNTSAFNCRFVAGTRRWSLHAYGRAIDVNPIQNPYVAGSHVSPSAGRAYLDRSRWLPGMIHRGDVAYRAFASAGWSWGGNWSSAKDYQHFQYG